MADKKRKKEDAVAENDESVNPGDCIGHWLKGDEACSICEIEDSCRQMTKDIGEHK